MCKGIERMRVAFAALDDAVRGINVTERRVIVERNANGFDLLGFFAVYNNREANFFTVNDDGSIYPSRFIRYYGGMGNKRIANDFGAPCAVVRHF